MWQIYVPKAKQTNKNQKSNGNPNNLLMNFWKALRLEEPFTEGIVDNTGQMPKLKTIPEVSNYLLRLNRVQLSIYLLQKIR